MNSPQQSERRIRVGVIDSGVNARHPHITVAVSGGISIGPQGRRADTWEDLLGHGTAVMAAIQEKAPEAEYFAVKVFHNALRTSADCLLEAIEWSIENAMDIVNLSLGTANPKHEQRFRAVVERAAGRGVLLVSAIEAGGQPSIPGCLPKVIGVGLDWNCDRNSYRVEQSGDRAIYYASGYPRSINGVPRDRNLNGISFAVANVTGIIAREQACNQRDEAVSAG